MKDKEPRCGFERAWGAKRRENREGAGGQGGEANRRSLRVIYGKRPYMGTCHLSLRMWRGAWGGGDKRVSEGTPLSRLPGVGVQEDTVIFTYISEKFFLLDPR